MKRISGSLSQIFVLAIVLLSCDTPADIPSYFVTGGVTLFDELGNSLPSADQVTVTLLGAGQNTIAQTDTEATGEFSLDLPETGEYSLSFRRDGFGTMYRSGVVQGGDPVEVDLFARSSAEVSSVVARGETCGTFPCLRLALTVDNFFGVGTGRRIFRVFLSTAAGVSSENYQVTDLLFVTNDQQGLQPNGTSAAFELDGLFGMIESFPSGSRVHVQIQGATENLASSYIHPVSGMEIFTDLSMISAGASFIMP